MIESKKMSMGYMEKALAQRKYRPLSVKEMIKEKLERTALEKFKGAFETENNENESKVSEKKAEDLYLLLKSARKRQ